jgi:hypothetical protein
MVSRSNSNSKRGTFLAVVARKVEGDMGYLIVEEWAKQADASITLEPMALGIYGKLTVSEKSMYNDLLYSVSVTIRSGRVMVM